MDRYLKNRNMLSEEECIILHEKRICVVGCGGLGGYVIEMFARIGIGHLTVVDGDVFDVTNLNRQLLSSEGNIGSKKAGAAGERVRNINSEIEVAVVSEFLSESNAIEILRGHDVVVDALDNISVRFLLESSCEKLMIPMVYGAIAGWYGQVGTIFPGDKMLKHVYKPPYGRGKEAELGNPSFTPALIASVQVSEALKLLLNRGKILRGKLLMMDLLNHDFECIELGQDDELRG